MFSYPNSLYNGEVDTIFSTKSNQVVGTKTLPPNLHAQYWVDVNVTNEKTKKEENTTTLQFEQFGPITPVDGTHTPEFFLNFDYH